MAKQNAPRVTVSHIARAIARLKDRGGSRYTDIRNALSTGSSQPSFFQLKAALTKACKEGVIRQNAQGRWLLNLAHLKSRGSNKEVVSNTSFTRRRRRKGKGKGRGRSKGRKRGRRRRRRRGKKGKGKGKGKGKKRKGRRRRRRRRHGRKGKKGR